MENMPCEAGIYAILLGGFALAAYREIKKEERERLYEIEENLIPAQRRTIKFLKNSKNKKNKHRLKYEIDSERDYLDYLLEKRSELCDKLNIDEFDDKQMETFVKKQRKRQEESIFSRSKSKVKAILAR